MSRYRIKRVPFCPYLPDDPEIETGLLPYGLWDTVERCYVNKYGAPDADYYAANRDVAIMRRRDLNHYAQSPGWRR